MYRLTEKRKREAQTVFDKYTRDLHDHRWINTTRLEAELRSIWDLGYQEIKDVMIDMAEHHTELTHLSAFFMEHNNPMGVVSEFQETLARLYGLSGWNTDSNQESARKAYWERAFAVISGFDLDHGSDRDSIITITSLLDQQLLERILRNPTDMRSMNPRAFEELIAEILDGFGFGVELSSQTRDGGRDIIAIANHEIAKSKYLIECKRYAEKRKIDVQVVRSLHGVVHDERATKGLIVTTSSFTKPAIEHIERNEWTLEGRDFGGICDWLKKYQQIRFGSAQSPSLK
ncbi:restriction endonuclease [Crateriforma conspicua]|uniref:restriction endonuclease n=1 Tax=Crateriforma conspicua TaxID=2527996 RepID=UPI00118D0B36|nr:restriction endonuclease [Crateriforma conspicua]QDV62187.1 Restriction endonuclease [Crateriforma conspicua]